MKKLYRKGTVHPTPAVVKDQLLSFLPAAILSLTVALSPEDREVLAYLISCSGSCLDIQRKADQKTAAAGGGDHTASFSCNCFRCYKSYWKKWDSSPNRQLIDEIIDAFEDSLLKESKKEKSKKERRKGKSVRGKTGLGVDSLQKSDLCSRKDDFHFGETSTAKSGGDDGGAEEEEDIVDGETEKGTVRRVINFLGERILKLWE
ncbi:uncharacterized protein LOC127249910 [Andrographis paniculata]|uniref:uncharacterized protein LOC127249910 n=1 Tax=Andrographis paniculata TaxID=175694 RepID=UPI0021E79442|nr:uncharacterized protein LOC127249910 [Andrographis paniculata]